MNDNEQIKAIAELDGKWKDDKHYKDTFDYQRSFGRVQSLENCIKESLPSYLSSRDAIVPVIEKWCEEDAVNRWFELLQQLNSDMDSPLTIILKKVICATPRQLSEALLRATGKWKD